ncbi:phosphatidylinositol 4-kinase [Babesia caballi]|uniref:Phosphatidylinositol 4-kinase n=1 Tax=Babesia caballi TaxID=5871 RepID=A0AAV4LSG8_BABCB|nr:phosphatidylinositol 4-kinase [Babesia caballi]
MDERPDSERQTQEDVDLVHHRQIEESIDRLNFASLSSFDCNRELHCALDEDEYIIDNVTTRVGVSRAIEHGVKLSSIIKAKALRLNEATALELLGVVLKIYCGNFSDQPESSQGESQATEQSSDSDSPQRELDFTTLSRFFSSKALCYSPLSWDTLPRPAVESQPSPQDSKRRRLPSQPAAAQGAPKRELTPMRDYNESLETQEHTAATKRKLLLASHAGPVPFWDFVLDEGPKDGFNRTCQNVYALTFLVVKGLATFSADDVGVSLQGRQEPEKEGSNAQGIVTAFSYDRWQDMLNNRKGFSHR